MQSLTLGLFAGDANDWKIRKGVRVRHISFLVHDDGSVIVRAPLYVSDKKINSAILKYRDKILKISARKKKKFESTVIRTDFDKIVECCGYKIIFDCTKPRFGFYADGSILTIFVDKQKMFGVKAVMQKALKYIGERVLLQRLEFLSELHNLGYNIGRVRNVDTIWGSCSSDNNITLSSRLVLLDQDLIDYVILHELAHTRYKNHSVGFWNFLDTIVGNGAKLLDSRLSAAMYHFKDILLDYHKGVC